MYLCDTRAKNFQWYICLFRAQRTLTFLTMNFLPSYRIDMKVFLIHYHIKKHSENFIFAFENSISIFSPCFQRENKLFNGQLFHVSYSEQFRLQKTNFRLHLHWKNKFLLHKLSSKLGAMGYFGRLGDSRFYWLRRQNLECNFGLSWFREIINMQFLSQMVLYFGNKSSYLTHFGALVAISAHKF